MTTRNLIDPWTGQPWSTVAHLYPQTFLHPIGGPNEGIDQDHWRRITGQLSNHLKQHEKELAKGFGSNGQAVAFRLTREFNTILASLLDADSQHVKRGFGPSFTGLTPQDHYAGLRRVWALLDTCIPVLRVKPYIPGWGHSIDVINNILKSFYLNPEYYEQPDASCGRLFAPPIVDNKASDDVESAPYPPSMPSVVPDAADSLNNKVQPGNLLPDNRPVAAEIPRDQSQGNRPVVQYQTNNYLPLGTRSSTSGVNWSRPVVSESNYKGDDMTNSHRDYSIPRMGGGTQLERGAHSHRGRGNHSQRGRGGSNGSFGFSSQYGVPPSNRGGFQRGSGHVNRDWRPPAGPTGGDSQRTRSSHSNRGGFKRFFLSIPPWASRQQREEIKRKNAMRAEEYDRQAEQFPDGWHPK